MSNYEQRDNSGSLFANDRRGDNERAPNAKGKAMIGGKMYYVSAWTKTAASSGQKYQSLSFEPVEEQQGGGQPARRGPGKWDGANLPQRPPRQPATQPFGDEDQQFKEADIPF